MTDELTSACPHVRCRECGVGRAAQFEHRDRRHDGGEEGGGGEERDASPSRMPSGCGAGLLREAGEDALLEPHGRLRGWCRAQDLLGALEERRHLDPARAARFEVGKHVGPFEPGEEVEREVGRELSEA
jgi:hypothetical protein